MYIVDYVCSRRFSCDSHLSPTPIHTNIPSTLSDTTLHPHSLTVLTKTNVVTHCGNASQCSSTGPSKPSLETSSTMKANETTQNNILVATSVASHSSYTVKASEAPQKGIPTPYGTLVLNGIPGQCNTSDTCSTSEPFAPLSCIVVSTELKFASVPACDQPDSLHSTKRTVENPCCAGIRAPLHALQPEYHTASKTSGTKAAPPSPLASLIPRTIGVI